MGDRVPISTWPGLASALLNQDLQIMPASVAYTVNAVYLQRNGNTAGDTISATVRNATGGGGSGITCDLGDGVGAVLASGPLAVAATEALYLRVTSVDTNSENLRGWVEIDVTGEVLTNLTTTTRVKSYAGITVSTYDALITDLINAVSAEIQTWLRRRIVQTTATDEPVDSLGAYKISLEHRPVISYTSIIEDGTTLVEDTDYESKADEKEAGVLRRLSGSVSIPWCRGMRAVVATYEHGYATVPNDIGQAATELVVFDLERSGAYKESRIGIASKIVNTGGDSTYITRRNFFTDQMTRLAHYRRM